MPCWTIQRSQVQFLEKSTDIDLLKKALEEMGFDVQVTESGLSFSNYQTRGTYNKKTGKLSSTGEDLDIDVVKQEYSKQVVEYTAQQNGWEIEWSTTETGEPKASVMKRGS